MTPLREVLDASAALLASSTPFVTVTLAAMRGSAPQETGAKALVTAAGLSAGTVGGGKLEAFAIRRAQAVLADRAGPSCTLETVNLQRDLGMTCGGEVSLLFERTDEAAWEVVVFGAGHVAQALVRVLLTLDVRVTVLDPRADWLERLPTSPSLTVIEHDCPADLVTTLRAGVAVVVMTQGHATDLPILDRALAWGGASFVGALGSMVKAARMRTELLGLGHTPDAVARLACPIGLPLGRSTPPEIAISVAAQLLQVRDAAISP